MNAPLDPTPALLDGMAGDLAKAATAFASNGHFNCRQLALDCANIAKRLAREARR